MRCPNCGTHHPSQYQNCVSCGQEFYVEDEILETPSSDQKSDGGVFQHSDSEPFKSAYREGQEARDMEAMRREELKLQDKKALKDSQENSKIRYDVSRKDVVVEFDQDFDKPGAKRRSRNIKMDLKSGMPITAGVLFGLVTLLVFAGATIFFLTKAPDQDRLLSKGLKELDNGQFAFAVQTLTKASTASKDNAKIMLALARAYVGVDQVDKAWECISKAQQMGKGVVEDPDLASQLANYYRAHNRYDKACDLLRPLAQKNIPGKKAELADLDALWGDQELRDGHLEKALTLWEEVKALKDGSRFSESDARLSTIYQRLAEKLIAEKKDKEALSYLGKLNAIADNARFNQMAADIYERTGQLELAIDQLRKASRFSTHDDTVQRKLASLLAKRGKELLDAGDLDAGYGYLQQAKSVDPSNTVPTVTLKTVTVDIQNGMPHITAQVWNPGDTPINALSMKLDLVDTKSADKVLWSKETALVDEFVPPMAPRDGKNIDLTGGAGVHNDGSCQFKVYFDGKLYNTYPIGKKERVEKAQIPKAKVEITPDKNKDSAVLVPVTPTTSPTTSPTPGAPAPGEVAQPVVPPVAPPVAPQVKPQSAEEKTMKELE